MALEAVLVLRLRRVPSRDSALEMVRGLLSYLQESTPWMLKCFLSGSGGQVKNRQLEDLGPATHVTPSLNFTNAWRTYLVPGTVVDTGAVLWTKTKTSALMALTFWWGTQTTGKISDSLFHNRNG